MKKPRQVAYPPGLAVSGYAWPNGGMPKRSSKKQSDQPQPTDAAPAQASEQPTEKNPAAVALGRLGGKKGGEARAKKLTKEQRSEIARKAAEARWKKRKP